PHCASLRVGYRRGFACLAVEPHNLPKWKLSVIVERSVALGVVDEPAVGRCNCAILVSAGRLGLTLAPLLWRRIRFSDVYTVAAVFVIHPHRECSQPFG